MKKRQKVNLSLPEDVMIEILMRLPFESILALKRVSKQWKDLINDPSFFNRYRDQSLSVFHGKDGLYCSLVRHGKKIPVTTVNERYHPPFTMRHITTIGSNSLLAKNWSAASLCNWMTCVVTQTGDFLLYNVLTGASYAVKSHTRWISHTRWTTHHGFGYDAYEDDYKIMVLLCDYELAYEGNSLFWVYSLRNGVWKKPLEGFPYAAYDWSVLRRSSFKPCSLDGVLHWGVATREDPGRAVIVTYDLHTCRFGEMLGLDGYDDQWESVCELRGQLCCWNYSTDIVEMWVMKEYGVRESWTLLFRLNCLECCLRVDMEPAGLYECQDGRKQLLSICGQYGTLSWYDIHNNVTKVICPSTWRKSRVIGGRGEKKRIRYIVAKN